MRKDILTGFNTFEGWHWFILSQTMLQRIWGRRWVSELTWFDLWVCWDYFDFRVSWDFFNFRDSLSQCPTCPTVRCTCTRTALSRLSSTRTIPVRWTMSTGKWTEAWAGFVVIRGSLICSVLILYFLIMGQNLMKYQIQIMQSEDFLLILNYWWIFYDFSSKHARMLIIICYL